MESYPSASGDVTILAGVTTINSSAFNDCNSLTSVTIPDSVTTIDYYAFEDCKNLESVTIGSGVHYIVDNVFGGCGNLTKFNVNANNERYLASADGKILFNKDKTVLKSYPSATGDVIIPAGVTEIGYSAFKRCSGLTSVVVPDSVTYIGVDAFNECTNLESVALGKNVKEIDSYAFEYCRSLTSVTIPDSVTKIGRNAFYDCDALPSVTFENTSGWNYSDYSDCTNGTEIDVTDEEQNATNLTDNYSDYYWYRVKVLTEDVINTNVYSYKLDIEDISEAWDGNISSPAFSVVLLTDKQVEDCQFAQDFYQATATEPEYIFNCFGNMKIADTSQTGSYAVYGQNAVNGEYQYYDGIAANITDTTVELFVDMSKISKTQLSALYEYGMTDDVIDYFVDFTIYKPYVIALGQEFADSNNYVFTAWAADVMRMAEGATFPTNPVKVAPKVPTANAINCIAGSVTSWIHTPMTDNKYTFIADGGDQFVFTMGNWAYRFADAVVDALDKEVELKEYFGGDPAHVTFADGVLAVGTEYVVTFIPVDDHTAKVKVSAK